MHLGLAVWFSDCLIMRRIDYPSYSLDDIVQIEPIISIHWESAAGQGDS
jgi:hypothetical protein